MENYQNYQNYQLLVQFFSQMKAVHHKHDIASSTLLICNKYTSAYLQIDYRQGNSSYQKKLCEFLGEHILPEHQITSLFISESLETFKFSKKQNFDTFLYRHFPYNRDILLAHYHQKVSALHQKVDKIVEEKNAQLKKSLYK